MPEPTFPIQPKIEAPAIQSHELFDEPVKNEGDAEKITHNIVDEIIGLVNDGYNTDFEYIILRNFGAEKTIEALENLFLDKNISADQKYTIANIIAEDISEYGAFSSRYPEFFNAFIDKIDLQNSAAQNKTRNLLEILRPLIHAIYTYLYEEEYAKQKSDFVERLKSLVDKKQNNYFLNLRLNQILQTNLDFTFGGSFSTDKDIFPFKISPEQFGFFKDGRLLITDASDHEKASPSFKKIDAYREYKEAELDYIKETLIAIDEYFESLPEEKLDSYGLEEYEPYSISYKDTDFDESGLTNNTIFEDLRVSNHQKESIRHLFLKYPDVKKTIYATISDKEDAFLQAEDNLINLVGITDSDGTRSQDENAYYAQNRFHIAKYEEELLSFFRDIHNNEIFLPQDNTPIDHSVQLADYAYLLSKPIRSLVEKEFGIKIEELSLVEQNYFLIFLKNKNIGEVDRVKKFLNTSEADAKINKIKSFLSLEHGGHEMGEKILAIGERFDQQTADLIFAKYAEIIDTVNSIEEELQIYLSKEKEGSHWEIADNLLKEGRDVLVYFSNLSAKKISPEEIIAKLERINANVLLTGNIIRQLPREEVAKLDLKNIPHIDKFEEIKASDLLSHPEILSQMKEIIKSQFPAGDDDAFEKECQINHNLRITVTLANKQVVAFFSKENKSANIDYVDWFIANPEAPIKGLGEATMRLGIKSEGEKNISCYAVAKPHAKSFQILVENLGFVAFQGSTIDNEYKHHYARIRQFPSDAEFVSKNLPESKQKLFFETIKDVCSEEKSTQNIIFEGIEMHACKIIYHGQTHHDDIKKTDLDGWIMQEIDRQNANRYVLTRFIPQNETKENQTFYAVFEKDSAPEDLKEELAGIVSPSESSSHSDSKKTFSN